MPYIAPDHREVVDTEIDALITKLWKYHPGSGQDGVVNYIFTRILKGVYKDVAESYFNYNRGVGVLEACKLEFYRRFVEPYEDKAITKNGDI